MLPPDYLVHPQLRTTPCFSCVHALWVTYLGPTLTVLKKQSEIVDFDFLIDYCLGFSFLLLCVVLGTELRAVTCQVLLLIYTQPRGVALTPNSDTAA